jgi:hypothetical protein
MQNLYRYLGWLISDKHAKVRIEALEALKLVYTYSIFVNKDISNLLHNFTARFGLRLVDMTHDVNEEVRILAVGLMTILQHSGMLEEHFDETPVFEKVTGALFDENGIVRRAAARFVIESLSNFDDIAGVEGPQKEHEGTPQIKQRAKNQIEDLVVLTLTQLKSEKMEGHDNDESNGEGEITLEQAKKLRGSIDYVVDAFAGIPSLHNWQCITELLKTCKSAKNGGAGKKTVLDDTGFVLLARLFRQSVQKLLRHKGEFSLPHFESFADEKGMPDDCFVARKMSKPEIEALQKSKDECNTHLAKVLPELLLLFRTDETISEDLLDTCQDMNLDVYIRRQKDFDGLVEEIRHHFLYSSSKNVCCAERFVCKSSTPRDLLQQSIFS